MKRHTSILLGLAFAFPLDSCAMHKTVTRDGFVTDASAMTEDAPKQKFDLSRAPGSKVGGYATTDGVHHAFAGRAWIEGDSMVFDRPARVGGMEADQGAAVRRRVSVSDLTSVDVVTGDTTRSIALLVVFTLAVAALYVHSVGSNVGFGGWQ
jgi:hypothetical protein